MLSPADELREANGGHWGEHPDYPLRDWRHEVGDDNTRLGYWEWVASCIESGVGTFDDTDEDEDGVTK
jgi:hypothetical protein